ncbi:MAG: amidinotransferase [Bacteroidetes bacterium]|nr:amidinotransferase [Bacteroidota bacterium]
MQTTKNILLVRPSNFVFNTETAASNAFQINVNDSEVAVKQKVLAEFEAFAATLKTKGVNVFIFDDTPVPQKPDAIFPNNWVTFHNDGTVILYPMCAQNRQYERRPDIIDKLRQNFTINKVVDLSHYEKEKRFLEGTGSIVFDHSNTIAYTCLSPRTDKELFIKVCDVLHYNPVFFHAHDKGGKEIYHTNVMMCIGEKFAVVCLDSITDNKEKKLVTQSLTKTGRQLIDISFEQMNNFAGNLLEIQTNGNKNIVALSQTAFDSLKSEQKSEIEKFCELVPLSIKTIETIGGGSARCMIAEIFSPS